MSGRIVSFFREYVLVFSIIALILGLIIFLLSLIHYFLSDMQPDFIRDLKDWNFYILIIGFIIFAAGIYYLYTYLKNKKFILDEIKTNKRSELLKKHAELKNTVRHMPKKFQKMLKDKEKELKIK
jgi:hypothetical protein